MWRCVYTLVYLDIFSQEYNGLVVVDVAEVVVLPHCLTHGLDHFLRVSVSSGNRPRFYFKTISMYCLDCLLTSLFGLNVKHSASYAPHDPTWPRPCSLVIGCQRERQRCLSRSWRHASQVKFVNQNHEDKQQKKQILNITSSDDGKI